MNAVNLCLVLVRVRRFVTLKLVNEGIWVWCSGWRAFWAHLLLFLYHSLFTLQKVSFFNTKQNEKTDKGNCRDVLLFNRLHQRNHFIICLQSHSCGWSVNCSLFLGVLTRNQKNLFIDIITDPTAYCFAASAGIKAQLHPHLRLHFKIWTIYGTTAWLRSNFARAELLPFCSRDQNWHTLALTSA